MNKFHLNKKIKSNDTKIFLFIFMIISILFLPFECESLFKQKIASNNKSTTKPNAPNAQLEENAEKFQKR